MIAALVTHLQDAAPTAESAGGIWGWLESNTELMGWMFAGSIVSLVLCILLLPVIVVRLEADYFVAPRSKLMANRGVGRWLWHIGKNMLGAVFVLVGVALLLLPGQGLLTIFIGLLMLEFPGKRAIELRIVRRPSILKLLNGMREKRGRAPFVIGPRPGSLSPADGTARTTERGC